MYWQVVLDLREVNRPIREFEEQFKNIDTCDTSAIKINRTVMRIIFIFSHLGKHKAL